MPVFADSRLLWQSQVLAQIHDAVVATDLDGNILSWNLAAEQLFGYGEPDAVGRPIDFICHATDRTSLGTHLQAAVQGQGPRNFVGRFRHSSGADLHAEVRMAVLRGEDGEPIGVVSCAHDVTRRLEQEAELRLQSRILDRMGEAVLLTGEAIAILYANPAAWRIFGSGAGGLAGLSIAKLLAAQDNDGDSSVMDEIRRALETQADWSGELECRRLDGSVFAAAASIGRTPLVDGVGWIWVLRDISERKAAEAALREREQSFRSMAEAAPVMVWTMDADGAFTYVNAAWRNQWGLSLAQARAGDWRRRLLPEALANVDRTVGEALRSRKPFHVEFEMTDAQARRRVILKSGAPLGDGDGFRGFIGSSTDITDIRQAEAERRQLDSRMESAQRLESLGVLAGGIAHDFNNLLVSILGFAELAIDELPSNYPSRASIEQVVIAARRAAELTQRILTFSGRARADRTAVNLRDLLLEMVQLLEGGLPEEAKLDVDLTPGLADVAADAAQLRQIVMNLLLNAADAVRERGGEVRLRLYPVVIDNAMSNSMAAPLPPGEGEYACLEVADSGCGMSEETQRKIFEPFFSTKLHGRGLGLASVLGIVRAHQGGIEVESRLAMGSRFRVYLPFHQPEAINPAREPSLLRAPALAGRGAGVLVVDDEIAVLETLKAMLRRRGYRVRTVADRAEALAVVEKAPDAFDIILFDLTMPGIEAAEALARLKLLCPRTPVLLASGYSEDSLSDRLEGRFGAGFLQKPFERERLFEMIDRILAGRPNPPAGRSAKRRA